MTAVLFYLSIVLSIASLGAMVWGFVFHKPLPDAGRRAEPTRDDALPDDAVHRGRKRRKVLWARTRGVSYGRTESMDISDMIEGVRRGDRASIGFALRALGLTFFVVFAFFAIGTGLAHSGNDAGWGFVAFMILWLGVVGKQVRYSYRMRRLREQRARSRAPTQPSPAAAPAPGKAEQPATAAGSGRSRASTEPSGPGSRRPARRRSLGWRLLKVFAGLVLVVGGSIGGLLLWEHWRIERLRSAPVPELIEVLRSDRSDSARFVAASTLAGRGQSARPAVPALVDALDDPDFTVSLMACWALGKLAPHVPEALHALIGALKNPSSSVQYQSVELLRGLGPAARPAIPALLDLVRDPATQADVRKGAISLLQQLEVSLPPEALPPEAEAFPAGELPPEALPPEAEAPAPAQVPG